MIPPLLLLRYPFVFIEKYLSVDSLSEESFLNVDNVLAKLERERVISTFTE